MVLLSNEFLCNTGYHGVVVQAEDFAVDFQFI